MNNQPESSKQPLFLDTISKDLEMQLRYKEVHGSEALKYRLLYEEAARQLTNLYVYAEDHGIELPEPGPNFS